MDHKMVIWKKKKKKHPQKKNNNTKTRHQWGQKGLENLICEESLTERQHGGKITNI